MSIKIYPSLNKWLFIYLFSSSSVICLELGRLTFKGGDKNIQNPREDIFYDAKVFLNTFFFVKEILLKFVLDKSKWFKWIIFCSNSNSIRKYSITLS